MIENCLMVLLVLLGCIFGAALVIGVFICAPGLLNRGRK